MKKIIFAVFLILSLLLAGFASVWNRADGLVVNGSYHAPIGIATWHQKDPDVCYEVVFGNVIWSILLSGTIVVPVYLIGWQILEPVPNENCPYR